MNVIRQNDVLKAFLPHVGLSIAYYKAATEGPVFEYGRVGKIPKEEMDYLVSIHVFADKPAKCAFIWSPFPAWRMYDNFNNGKIGFTQVWHYEKDNSWKMARYDNYDDNYKGGGRAKEIWQIMEFGPTGVSDYRVMLDGVWDAFDLSLTAEQILKAKEGAVENLFGYLAHFLAHVSLPGSTVLRISPAPDKNKTTKWHQARTHYVVISRQQAQAIQKSRRAHTQRDITLAAHWRRAHFRRLSSDKFIHKRGLMVPVRHAWVGPKEWEGSDRKVYKLVEPNVPPPITGDLTA